MLLFISFEVVNRLDDSDDICGRSDVVDDILHILVSHGAFIQRLTANSRGVDALHLLLKLFDR